MTFQLIDIDAIRKAPLRKEPYPFMIIENVILRSRLAKVVESFPTLPKRGSFPLSAVACSGDFDLLMKELMSPELRRAIGERFGMDLEERPPMITVRGHTTERDGHIHVDSSDKLITFLLYLNPGWTSPEGKIRVLYNRQDLAPFAAELSPEAGHCLIFKVTKDCWHGHTVFEGERKSIQLNYVTSSGARERHLKRHSFSAYLKRLFRLYREGFKNRNMARRRPEFEPGLAGAEAAKLNKFSDAGGTQILWLPDAAPGVPINASFLG